MFNGYKLPSYKKNIMDIEGYHELLKLLNSNGKRLTYDQFINSTEFCTEWNKGDLCDPNCEWNTTDVLFERENVIPNPNDEMSEWDLAFKINTTKLWELPFHTDFLARMVELGCRNREESVHYSNFVGYWVQEKYKQIHNNK
jgi:hypothetical protein